MKMVYSSGKLPLCCKLFGKNFTPTKPFRVTFDYRIQKCNDIIQIMHFRLIPSSFIDVGADTDVASKQCRCAALTGGETPIADPTPSLHDIISINPMSLDKFIFKQGRDRSDKLYCEVKLS